MEDKEKVPPTSEPNPEAGNEDVKTSDLEGGESQPEKDAAKEGDSAKKEDAPKPEGEGNPAPKKQSRETDAIYAERRRKEKEREATRQKERENEIRRQAVFEVKSGQVSSEELSELGLAKVEDEDQLFLVENLRKAKAEGIENPQAYAYQTLFKKQATERADAKAKAEAEKADEERKKAVVAQDQKNFQTKFGKSTADVIKNEPEFMELFGGLIDSEKGNFTSLYTAYTTMKAGQAKQVKAEGAFPTNSDGSSSKEQEESDEEFMKRWRSRGGH